MESTPPTPENPTLDLAQLARLLRYVARGSGLVWVEDPDPGLSEQVEAHWDFEGCFEGPRSEPEPQRSAIPPRRHEAPAPMRARRPGPSPAPPVEPSPVIDEPAKPPSPVVRTESPKLEPMDSKSLDSLHFRVAHCVKCGLSANRRAVVFGQGNQKAFLMVLGDQPSKEDDPRGLAFCGPDGDMLEKILLALGLSKESAYLTNAVKCRPDGDRPAHEDERAACAFIFGKQIELLGPKMLLALGEAALRSLVPQAPPWVEAHGKVFQVGNLAVAAIEHPRDLLADKALVGPLWEDLRRIRQEFRKWVNP
ncbi:MAG: uracil-DNA glycosylase family protein [bacterium]|nr:uracil-DNA glycosylase family protein [bacterium]